MEKKNMVLLTVIAVATLLVAVVGATFAYFTATITDDRGSEGNNGQAAITATQTPGNLIIEKSDTGFSSFNEDNVYPGHKELIQLKITSEANNITDTFFNIVYEGTNTFPNDMIEFDIYESDEAIDGTEASEAFKCTKKSEELTSGSYKLYEDCQLDEKLQADLTKKHLLQNTKLQLNSEKVILNGIHPFVITGTAQKRTMYYYIVVTYKDTLANQTGTDQGKKLNGTINVEIAARDNEAIKDDEDHITQKAGE